MAGRSGFFGRPPGGDAPGRDADEGFGADRPIDGPTVIRLGDPNAGRSDQGAGLPPGFDPIWGTLGAPTAQPGEDWLVRDDAETEGVAVDVEIFGAGFQISGQLRTGQFDRLTDWINMQTGFIVVRNAQHSYLGQANAPDPDERKGTLWVRLDQIVLVAERSPAGRDRPSAPVVQKRLRRVSIVAPGYNVSGSIHLVAHGSISQYLESPDPRFLPITDLTVRWLSDAALIARFPFALVNRGQLVTLLDEQTQSDGEVAPPVDPGRGAD